MEIERFKEAVKNGTGKEYLEMMVKVYGENGVKSILGLSASLSETLDKLK